MLPWMQRNQNDSQKAGGKYKDLIGVIIVLVMVLIVVKIVLR